MQVVTVFSYNNVIKLIQSLSLVYLVFNFEICSLVINIAIIVNRAALLETLLPAPGLIKPLVEELIVEADPINNSAIITSIFFYLNFYISSYNIHFEI